MLKWKVFSIETAGSNKHQNWFTDINQKTKTFMQDRYTGEDTEGKEKVKNSWPAKKI